LLQLSSILTTAFESTGDFQAGLEDKGIFGRYKQAQAYLERAQETHKIVEVQVATRLNAYRVTDFTSLSDSIATYIRSVLAAFGNFSLAPVFAVASGRIDREIAPAFVIVNPTTVACLIAISYTGVFFCFLL
jgi:hypothetical protein